MPATVRYASGQTPLAGGYLPTGLREVVLAANCPLRESLAIGCRAVVSAC